jgi:hypothetical protein
MNMTEESKTIVLEKVENLIIMKSDEATTVTAAESRSDDKMTFSNGKPPPQGVKYRVEYLHKATEKIVHSMHTDRLDYELVDTHGTVFDIVTTFLTPESEFKVDAMKTETVQPGTEQPLKRLAPLVTDTRRKIDMHIHSQAVIHALRSVVRYYPGQSLMGETVIIPAPYMILVHHEKELNEYKERCHPSKLTDPICPKERDACRDINLIQEFLEQKIMPKVRLERERNLKGLETFEMMWVRQKPGTTTKYKTSDSSSWNTAVIESHGDGTQGFGGGGWNTKHWCLQYNGSWLGSITTNILQERFEGERSSKDTEILDEKDFEEPLGEAVKDLVEEGEKCFKLLSKTCQYYKGKTFGFPHNQVRLLVFLSSLLS